MVNDITQFAKYREERSGELVLSCFAGRNSVSAVLYDTALSRSYARAVRFGFTLTHSNAAEAVNGLLSRLLRESRTPGNAVRKLGFAAPADVTLALEEAFDPTELFLPPDIEVVILPMLSAAAGGELTAALAYALKGNGSVIAADINGGFRAAAYSGGTVSYACIPLKGGLDGTALESGMPLENGAIDRLSREPDGTLCYSVIGDGDGIGISAPAAAQAVRIMLDIGALDSDGIMTDRDLFYIGEDHYVSQSDVRAVQSDKASCRAALERFGALAGRHDSVIISGEAFGSEQGAAAMARLGAVPKGLAERYGWSRRPGEQGLIYCLTDPELLAKMYGLCDTAADISHLVYDGFDDLYIKNLAF